MLTQPITLITGVPGAGKTLRAIYEGLELQKKGREVFALGIDGLDPSFIETVPENFNIEDWKTLPKGAVLLIDEAHKFLPTRQPGKPPQWIQDLTEIRHYGISFILITQDPRNIDAFVRRLIGEHLHLTRKAGLAGAMVRTFQGVAEDPNDFGARQSSSQTPWMYPKELYKVYESASLHVIKPKLPLKIIFAILFTIILLFLVPYLYFSYNKAMDNTPQPEGEKSALSQKIASNSEDKEPSAWDTPETFVKAHTATVPVAPWSAPIYKDLSPTQTPRILCLISGKKDDPSRRCFCKTEQMTTVEGIPPVVCEKIAKDGIYHPYLESSSNSNVGVTQMTTSTQGQSADAPEAGSSLLITSPSP